MKYRDKLSQAMAMLAADSRTIFLGQGVLASGTFMSTTLHGVPREKRIELPVAEEMQMGMSIGLAQLGYVPITIYPRWNFLILAANQLVNHLDKMQSHVIVRVGIGSEKPLYPGPQHVGDFTAPFKTLMSSTTIIQLEEDDDVVAEYRRALYGRHTPTVLVERADSY